MDKGMRVETRLQQGLQFGLVAQLVAQLTFNQLVVGSSPTEPIMKNSEQMQATIEALQKHDKVIILANLIVEHWLDGSGNPPKDLIDLYYDKMDEASVSLCYDRLHEQVVTHNGEFYEEIHAKFGLSENKKKNLDSTPDLF